MTKNYDDYVDGVISGSRLFLAKTITLIESTSPVHREIGSNVVEKLLPKAGKSIRIGVTGVPGVGKSTFIDSFGIMVAEKGYKLAVLAIDPSSSISGGSIMADKTRMEKLAMHPSAFIRPSPSGGTLGGVARMTREAIIVCEAAGFDVVIVETVGVGQSETSVASMVDFFLVLMLAGAGDELQGIKKGVLEIADALVINKADGDNVLKAEQARELYKSALRLLNPVYSGWSPPVLTCSATIPSGLGKIWEKIIDHHEKLSCTGELLEKRCKQSIDWMWSRIQEGLNDYFFRKSDVKDEISRITEAVGRGEIAPNKGAEAILSFLH